MKRTSDRIYGWKEPSQTQLQLAVDQWRNGVGFGLLRFGKGVGLVLTLFLTAVFGIALAGGDKKTAVGAVFGILLFAVLFLVMRKRIKTSSEILARLQRGDFTVVRVIATGCYSYKGSRNYMGHVRAELPNGDPIGEVKASYGTIKLLRRGRRFPVAVMLARMNGDNELLAFATEYPETLG